MSRYRPPRPPSSKYITPEGAAALRAELDDLWRRQRPAVTAAVAEAAAQGDRSENAAYVYGKKQLAQIDSRVRYLSKRLDGIRVVDAPPADAGRIFFGAWFALADGAGRQHRYRLVGPDEIGVDERYVSIDSPLGRAVLGKTVGDELTVQAPEGERRYAVVDVAYAHTPASTQKKSPAEPGQSQGENDSEEKRR
jgi:transcription elongation factor GreB